MKTINDFSCLFVLHRLSLKDTRTHTQKMGLLAVIAAASSLFMGSFLGLVIGALFYVMFNEGRVDIWDYMESMTGRRIISAKPSPPPKPEDEAAAAE